MHINSIKLLLIISALLLCSIAQAQPVQPTSESQTTPLQTIPSQPSQSPSELRIVPNGTPILVEITDLVSTKTAVRDDMFNLKLSTPIELNGEIIIPAGTIGKGQVVDSGKPRIGGGSAQLVIAARYLEYKGQRIPIRGLKLDVGGHDRSNASVGLSSIGLLAGPAGGFAGFFVSGGHMEVPAGTLANAKLGADYVINSGESSATPNNGN